MRGGFTFCGHDIANYGIIYAPENEDMYIYRPAKTKVHEESFDGRDGSYIYGAYKEAKEFVLRCYYEETRVDRGLIAKVRSLFRIGKSGQLVFARRPWCAYYATVIDVDDKTMFNYENGLVTIVMKAGYPFARGINQNDPMTPEHLFYSLPSDPHHGEVMENTGLFESATMVPAMSFTNVSLTAPQTKSILLANPGTERASVGIIASGNSGTGVIIANKTTKQECKLVAMSRAETTNVGKEVFVDGLSGKTVLRNELESTISFLYHDSGFIELEPSFPVIRNLYITTNTTNTISVTNIIDEDVIGKYIFAKNYWRKIVNQTDEHTLIVSAQEGVPSLTAGTERTIISSMNEITISPVNNMSFSKLAFSYKPTYS